MKKQHIMISFDSDSWEQLKQCLGLLGPLKCKYCGTVITKENIGGVSNPKEVFCKTIGGLARHVIGQDDEKDINCIKDEVEKE